METRNAIIENVSLEIDDHGVLTMWLGFSYGVMHQWFGGYALCLPKYFAHYEKRGFAGHFIYRVFQIAGVTRYKDLIGKTVRVKCEHSEVHEIGHIIKEDWFNPQKDFTE